MPAAIMAAGRIDAVGVRLRGATLLLACAALASAPSPAAAADAGGVKDGREVMLVANAEDGTVAVVDARSFRVLRRVNVLPDGPNATVGEDDPAQALIRQQVVEAAGGRTTPRTRTSHRTAGRSTCPGPSRRHCRFRPAQRPDAVEALDPRLPLGPHDDLRGRAPLYVSALTENVAVASRHRARAVVGSFGAGQWPHDNHLSPDGKRLYNGSIGTIIAPEEARQAVPPAPYQLTIVETAGLRPVRSFRFDRGIRPIVITHDERRMYAQLSHYHGVIEFDLAGGRITRRLELPVDAGVSEDDWDFEAPHHGLTISPDERTLCAAGRASDYVALVSTATFRPPP